jgi:hypothetical protein
MDVARLILTVERWLLELKQAIVEGRKQAAVRADHPAGEGCDGHTKQCIRIVVLWDRWCPELRNLCPQFMLDSGQQTRLPNRRSVVCRPLVQTHNHHREIRQVNHGANAESMQ